MLWNYRIDGLLIVQDTLAEGLQRVQAPLARCGRNVNMQTTGIIGLQQPDGLEFEKDIADIISPTAVFSIFEDRRDKLDGP